MVDNADKTAKYASIVDAIRNGGTGGAAGPVSGANRPEGKFYGVPDDYISPNAKIPYVRQPPQYETATDDDRRILLGLPAEQLADVQDALKQVGLIGKSGYRKGIVDESTRKAFSDLLGFANQQGTDWRSALVLYAQSQVVGDEEGGANRGRDGNITRVTSAADLGYTASEVAEERLGRKLKTGEAQKFASQYQGIERAQGQRVVEAKDAAAGGAGFDGTSSEIMDAPDPRAAADQFVDSNFAQEAAGQSAYGYFEALQQMLGGR